MALWFLKTIAIVDLMLISFGFVLHDGIFGGVVMSIEFLLGLY